MNGNWIKLHRDLRGKFSYNKRIDASVWHIYIYLMEKANWIDGDICKRGQVITTHKIIFDDLAILSRNTIRTSMKLLCDKEFIQATRINNWKNCGYLVTILQYDVLQGENSESYPQKLTINQPSFNHQSTINQPTLNHHSTINQPSQLSCNDLDNTEEIAASNGLPTINQPSFNHQSTINQPSINHQSTINQPYNSKEEEKEEEKEKEGNKISSCDSLESSPSKISYAAILASAKKPEPKTKKTKTASEGINPSELIGDYITAYSARYGVKPLITGVVAATAKNLIKRVGLEKAKQLVKFYLTHNNQYYLGKAHDLKLCLADAEKLHTEMCKQNYIYTTDARDFEQASSNEAIRLRLIEKHRERD